MQVVNWREPVLHGDVPQPRKGAAAACCQGRIIMLGGTGVNAEEQPVVLDELVVLDIEGPNELLCTINPSTASGPRPAPRSGATMFEYTEGQLLLYGGIGVDDKPLNDAFTLDVDTLTWQRIYNGSSDLVGPQGEKPTLAPISSGQELLPHGARPHLPSVAAVCPVHQSLAVCRYHGKM